MTRYVSELVGKDELEGENLSKPISDFLVEVFLVFVECKQRVQNLLCHALIIVCILKKNLFLKKHQFINIILNICYIIDAN